MLLEGDKCLLDLGEDYSQFFGDSCNWYNYTVLEISGENEAILGAWEVTFALLGLHVRFRYQYTETEKWKWIKEQVNIIHDMED